MTVGEQQQTAVAGAALGDLRACLLQLVAVVEDGALGVGDDLGLTRFLQDFEEIRNLMSLVDHQAIAEGIGAVCRRR